MVSFLSGSADPGRALLIGESISARRDLLAGEVGQVRLRQARAEARGEAVAEVGVERAGLVVGEDGAAAAAVERVAAPPADRVAGHRAAPPRLVDLAVEG